MHQQDNASVYLILTPLTGAVELQSLRQRGDAVLAVHLQLLDPRPATHAIFFTNKNKQFESDEGFFSMFWCFEFCFWRFDLRSSLTSKRKFLITDIKGCDERHFFFFENSSDVTDALLWSYDVVFGRQPSKVTTVLVR